MENAPYWNQISSYKGRPYISFIRDDLINDDDLECWRVLIYLVSHDTEDQWNHEFSSSSDVFKWSNVSYISSAPDNRGIIGSDGGMAHIMGSEDNSSQTRNKFLVLDKKHKLGFARYNRIQNGMSNTIRLTSNVMNISYMKMKPKRRIKLIQSTVIPRSPCLLTSGILVLPRLKVRGVGH